MNLQTSIGLAIVVAVGVVAVILAWIERRQLQRDLNKARNQVEHWTAAALKHSLHAKQLEDDFEKAANLLVEHGDFIEWVKTTVEAMAEHITDPMPAHAPTAITAAATPAEPATTPTKEPAA